MRADPHILLCILHVVKSSCATRCALKGNLETDMAQFGKGDIVVIGAGLVGSLLAYILQKKGFTVTVFERYGDIRQIPSLGRSINLVITNRGLRACDAIGGGLREELLTLAVPVTGRVIHQLDGTVLFQRYGKDDSECNYSISRFGRNRHRALKVSTMTRIFMFSGTS